MLHPVVLDQDNAHFRCRSAGVVVHNKRVLLNRMADKDFWFLPGGGVHILEPAHLTLQREMQEELAQSITVERLLWIVESFHQDEQKAYHSLGFYFLIHFLPDSIIYQQQEPFDGQEEQENLIFQWYPLDQLSQIELYPRFLRTALANCPDYPVHIVDIEEND